MQSSCSTLRRVCSGGPYGAGAGEVPRFDSEEFLSDFFASPDALDPIQEARSERFTPEDEFGHPGDDDDGAVALDSFHDRCGDVFGCGAGPTRRLGNFAVVSTAGSRPQQARPNGAGTNRGDAETETTELTPNRLAEPDEAELARAVGGQSRTGDQAADAGGIDDVSLGLLKQERQQAARQADGSMKIDGEDPVPLGFGRFQRGAVPGDAGVVDQDVDFAPDLSNGFGEGVNLRGIGEVAGVDGDAKLLLLEFGGNVCKTGGIAIDEQKLDLEGSETPDNLPADAGGGTGDENFHAGIDTHGIAQKNEGEKPEIAGKDTGLAGWVKRGCGAAALVCTFVYVSREMLLRPFRSFRLRNQVPDEVVKG